VFNQGQILGADGERMSKSRGNVQDPDELVAKYGADTVRLFLMFMGPWDQGGPWSPTGIGGVHRFLNRVWALALDPHYQEPGDPDAGTLPAGQDEAAARAELRAAAHRTLRDVTADYEAFHFNTMVAKLMELSNTLFRYRGTAVAGSAEWDEAMRLMLLMLAPAAPHVTEELWSRRVAGCRPWRGRGVDARGAGAGQRQGSRPGRRAGRRRCGGHRARCAGVGQGPGDPRRPRAGSGHPGGRRPARERGRARLTCHR
jgi:leucyl-tRNA synthetase